MTLRFALDLFNVNTGKKHSGHGLYQDGDLHPASIPWPLVSSLIANLSRLLSSVLFFPHGF